MFTYKIRTRYSETAQDKIIHHSSFVIYLEIARIEFFKTIGCDINELEAKQMYCPVTHLSIKYLKPLRSLQDIVVNVAVQAYSKVRFSLKYQILLEETAVALGTIEHCFLNEFFKPIPIPKLIIEQFEAHLREDDFGTFKPLDN